jgi:hypothetical protein
LNKFMFGRTPTLQRALGDWFGAAQRGDVGLRAWGWLRPAGRTGRAQDIAKV